MTQVYANASEFELIAGGFLLCPLCGNPLRDTSTINQSRPRFVQPFAEQPCHPHVPCETGDTHGSHDDCPMPDVFKAFIAGLDI